MSASPKIGKKFDKPWGHYRTLYAESSFQVKRIEVRPGHRLSYQKHLKRLETWTVVSGTGLATIDGRAIPVKPGSAVYSPLGVLHRMANTGKKALVFIEVQVGDYLGEDDIVRVEDDYDRLGTGPGAVS